MIILKRCTILLAVLSLLGLADKKAKDDPI